MDQYIERTNFAYTLFSILNSHYRLQPGLATSILLQLLRRFLIVLDQLPDRKIEHNVLCASVDTGSHHIAIDMLNKLTLAGLSEAVAAAIEVSKMYEE